MYLKSNADTTARLQAAGQSAAKCADRCSEPTSAINRPPAATAHETREQKEKVGVALWNLVLENWDCSCDILICTAGALSHWAPGKTAQTINTLKIPSLWCAGGTLTVYYIHGYIFRGVCVRVWVHLSHAFSHRVLKTNPIAQTWSVTVMENKSTMYHSSPVTTHWSKTDDWDEKEGKKARRLVKRNTSPGHLRCSWLPK